MRRGRPLPRPSASRAGPDPTLYASDVQFENGPEGSRAHFRRPVEHVSSGANIALVKQEVGARYQANGMRTALLNARFRQQLFGRHFGTPQTGITIQHIDPVRVHVRQHVWR